MVLLAGVKGTGKTKALIEKVNTACASSKGQVILIAKGNQLVFDIDHATRLVDTNDYGISGSDMLYGFICGLLSANFDITDVFVDGAFGLCNSDIQELEILIQKINAVMAKNNVNCTITASVDPSLLSESARNLIAK